MKNNVTLIGMPSAGKSTVGVLLAKRLGYSFIDVDLLIQEQEGKRLREIIEEQGLDGFLDVENRVNAGVEAEQAVIAPGGSVIYGKEAMEHLKSIGLVVYLKITYDELVKRVGDVKDRGVALKEQQTVQPIVHLQPYRTFLEVKQPASDFLLRIDKDGHPALYEADGGAWKLEAKRRIAAYLGEQLADLMESGNVVVMI